MTVSGHLIPQTPDIEQQPKRFGAYVSARRTALSFAIAFAVIAFAFSQMDIDFAAVWRSMRGANPALLALALVAYYASFPIRALRWRTMLENAAVIDAHAHDRVSVPELTRIYLLAWLANCIAPAKLGDMYRGYLLKQRTNASFARTFGTIVSERLLDVVSLMLILTVAGGISFHGTIPGSLQWWLLAGGVLAGIAIGALVVLAVFSRHIRELIPARVRPHYVRVEEGILASLSRRSLPLISLLTALIWMLEGVRVFAIVRALGIDLDLSQSLFIALLASLLTAFPITPAGLGAVESGSIVALKLFDVSAVSAGAITLIDRGIAYWSVIIVGGLVWLLTARRGFRIQRTEAPHLAPDVSS